MLGYRVVAADISRSALDAVSATRLARAALCVQFDADAWPFRDACFDVVVQVDFLDRRLLPLLRAAVKPGGVVLIDTFAGPASDSVTGPRRSDFRLDYEELEQRFADWELVQTIDEPPPHARSAVLARRPLR
jgi:SAM-dependent methyltransferase